MLWWLIQWVLYSRRPKTFILREPSKMKVKLTAIDPNGEAHTRTTAREYKFVVFAKLNPKWYPNKEPETHFRHLLWTTRRDLAEKEAHKSRGVGWLEVTITPVEGTQDVS